MSVTFSDVAGALEAIAPLELAEEWDNVGWIIRGSKPASVRRILLTIDLTPSVLDEALRKKVDLVVAYHPPIFTGLKRLDCTSVAGSIAVRAIEAGIAVYSPHTALDSVTGGVNDWLADGLGPGKREPIQRASSNDGRRSHKVVVFVPPDSIDAVRDAMANAGAGVIGNYTKCSFGLEGTGTFLGDESSNPTVGKRNRFESTEEMRLEMVCGEWMLPAIGDAIRASHPYEEPAWDVYELTPCPSGDIGQGRSVHLDRPVGLATLIKRIKLHLKLERLRVAQAPRRREKVECIKLCAGAGGSVLGGEPADVFLTGEMRHHDVLAANAQGTTVILTDHTNTERGYLPTLKKKIQDELGNGVAIDISKVDADPLRIV